MVDQRYVNIQLQGLVAKIKGPSLINIGNKSLTIDASGSYNPNENDTKKDLLFTWKCDISADDNCRMSTTKSKYLGYYHYV